MATAHYRFDAAWHVVLVAAVKIAILAHIKHPISQPFFGGLEMHTHLLARLLRQRGHRVTLFCAHGSDPALDPICLSPPTGEPTGDPDRDAEIDATEFLAYAAMMERVAKGGFELVHNNSLHDLPLRQSRSLSAPMVTVLHTPPFDSLRAGVRDATSVFVAVSDSLASEWQEHAGDIRVVGNGIDLAGFTANAPAGRGAHAIWSGRIVREKGLHLAMDAARAAGLPLAFAGPRGDPAYWREAIAPRLGPDLLDLGHLDHAQLAAQIAAARVALVTPCWDEPFGLVVAEALACGTPVAGFRRGALPEILDGSSGRLARPDDIADLARAIREAVHLDRGACRARAEALFDAELMIDRYEAVYGALLGRSSLAVPAAHGLDTTEV